MPIVLKSKTEIAKMREAGRVVAAVLELLREAAKPGVTTQDLDVIAQNEVTRRGARAAFLGYRGYPASVCTSVNDEIVHGIPSKERVLKEGDIVSLDFGAVVNGYYGDSATTVGIGRVSRVAADLMLRTEEALRVGIAGIRVGGHLSDVSAAIQRSAESHGYSVVRKYVGHGIGRAMHEQPDVPNFGDPGHGPVLRPGLVIAVEPMVNTGTWETRELADGWTVVTADGGLSAHFEHTVAVTEQGPEILTLP